MQEPNVKESAGGLRDLHVLLWASRIAHGQATLEGLARAGVIPERDAKAIGSAYEFLLRVRNELHFMTSRRTDALSLDLQQEVARNLRYVDSAKQQASEIFMRDYYLRARLLRRLCESHLQRAVAGRQKKSWFTRARSTAAIGGFVMSDGALDLVEAEGEPAVGVGELAEIDGQRMMMAFSYAQATGAGFSVKLQDAILLSLPVVNRAFRSSAEAAQAFLKLLRVKGRVASARHVPGSTRSLSPLHRRRAHAAGDRGVGRTGPLARQRGGALSESVRRDQRRGPAAFGPVDARRRKGPGRESHGEGDRARPKGARSAQP
jgi:[protein-PII] uridylyltransferase